MRDVEVVVRCGRCEPPRSFTAKVLAASGNLVGAEVLCPAGHRLRLAKERPAPAPAGCGFTAGAAGEGPDWFHGPSPAEEWNRDSAKRVLDELFHDARAYRKSQEYVDMLRFVATFRQYAPFNAMLIHAQRPGARFVAPHSRWETKWKRRVRWGARPIVILQPKGPVMFVYDVSDVDPLPGAPSLPRRVEKPFEVRSGTIGEEYDRLILNARRDGVEQFDVDDGSQQAGLIRTSSRGGTLDTWSPYGAPAGRPTPRRYELEVNVKLSKPAKFATAAHELGHLYCGHLGAPAKDWWWPDRRGLERELGEFEAESVCHLVCGRLGIDDPSDEYLAGYVAKHPETPPISLDRVMAAAGLILQMAKERLPPRKEIVPRRAPS